MGIDPISGLNSSFDLLVDLRDYLADYGIYTPSHVHNTGVASIDQSYWLSMDDLDLDGDWKSEWTCFIKGLLHGGIRLSENKNTLIWMHNKENGKVTTMLAYDLIVSTNLTTSPIKTHNWFGTVLFH